MRDEDGNQSGPLAGIRVLDFGTFVAGSYNAVLMGDLGAEVIKVESVGGDPARGIGPFYDGESRPFMGWNRNKRSLAVDIATEEGLRIVYALVAESDVVTGNFRPGSAEKLKIDYETLSASNPRLIYCSSTGFGPKGPLSGRPAYDAVFQSMGGVATFNELTMGKKAVAGPIFIDVHTAMLALTAVLAALYHRERTGVGQKVETSLLQGVMSAQPASYCRPLEVQPARALGAFPYKLYETGEGLIFIAIAQDKFWPGFCKALGDMALANDSRFESNANRVEHEPELTARIQPVMMTKTALEWEPILVDHGVPCGVVMNHDEFLAHPQVEAMGMNPVINHTKLGAMRVYGVPIDLEKSPGAIQRCAPQLGEHTEEILRELSYGNDEIESLKEQGVITTV